MNSRRKVVLVTNIPSPYRIPLFNELTKQLRNIELDLVVIFGNRIYSRRKFDAIPEKEYEFEFHFLNSETINFGNEEKTYFSYKGLFKLIKMIDPACVIMNGFTIAATRLWLQSFISKRPYILWVGSVIKQGRFDSMARRIQRKLIINRSASFIAYGSMAREYLLKMNAPPEKIFIGINTVDTSFFKSATESIRSQGHIKEKHHLTYIGYLSKRKNVNKVLEVVQQLQQRRNDFILDLIGDGPEKEALENYVKESGITDLVRFHGFKQKDELPGYLAVSDCLLFQTDFDIWGLVLNETLAAGVPVIASTNAGATKDLIIDGVTGYISDYNDPIKVCEIIEVLFDNQDLAKKISDEARAHVSNYASIEVSARGFADAVKFGLS